MKKFLLTLFLLSLAPLAQAQLVPQEGFEEFDDLEAIEIKSTTLRSVNVSFIGPKESGKIKGIVIAPSPLRRAKTLVLEIVDPNGAVLLSETIEGKEHWGRVLRQHEFVLEVPENGLAEGSVFEVSVYSGSQLVAFGEKDLPKLARPPNYTVKDLEVLAKDDKLFVSFAFTNTTFESVKMVPKLELESLSNFNTKPKTSFLSGVSVGPKSEKVLTYEVDLPENTGLYEASVSPLTVDKRLMAGSLKSTVVVGEGFGMISKFRLEPVLDEEAFNYKLILEGVSDQNLGRVELALRASQKGDGVSKRIQENQAFQSSTDGFSIEVPLTLENAASTLEGEIRVTSKQRVLSARKFSFEVDRINELGDPVRATEETVVEKEPGFSKWFLAVALIIIVLVLIILLWFFWQLSRKKNSKNLLILILSLGVWQSVWAEALENFWYHPLPGWTYNPTATGQFASFNLIHFRGNIFNSLTQKGFFQVDPTRVVVKFVQDDGTRLYAESFNYEIDQKKIYKFDLSVPEGLAEGDWGMQIYFLMDGTWYVTTWTDESSGLNNEIKIDNTPPTVSEVEFDGETYTPANRLVRPGIDTLKASRQAFLVNRSHKTKDIKQAAINISTKRKLRRDKINLRNAKIDRLKDKEILKENLPPDVDAGPVDAQIDSLITEINTLSSQINGLTNELGQNIPNNSVFSTADLDSDAELTPVQNGPPGTLPATFNCPISAGSTPFNGFHLSNCISALQTLIGTLNTQIQAEDTQIRTRTERFKPSSIGIDLICDDTDSGCYAACNPADEICDIDCDENPAACSLYQNNSPIDYADNCSGTPLVCEVDCVQDPDVCRRGSFNFSVRGNFCDDATYCDTTAPKDFQVCDNVGNCAILTDTGVETDWYDPVKPDLTESLLIRNKDNVGGTETSIDGQGSDTLAADERLTFEITAADPLKPTAAEYPTLFDENACGFGANDDFFHATGSDTFCSQSNVACALSSNIRGNLNQRIGGACSGVCPEGYLLDVNNFCVPQCDFRLFDGCFPFLLIGDTCETSIWLPLETTVPIGQSFIQTSNCGETRTAIGTKPLTESLKHFLDGKDAFGVFFYDTFEDDISFSNLIYSPSFDLGTAGYGGETSTPSAEATFSHESGFSPAGGNVLKIASQNLQGGYAAWSIDGITVAPNRDYIFTYWVKTNGSINKNEQGAWVRITGNGSSTDIFTQYSATMEGVDSDMLWHRVELPFRSPSGTTQIDIELRLEGQNNRSAYFDDLKLFEENWRYDSSKSWYTEPLDDQADGICDYMLGDGDGDPRGGFDDRCGQQTFPEKVVVAFANDGLYIFDVIKGTLWMSARQDPNPTNWGRLIFNSLLFGDSYGLNGKLYSTFRFAQGGGKNGAVIVGDFIADTIYSHRMNNCFTLAGYKGSGSSYTTYRPAGCSQNAYNWSGYVNADQASRNSADYPWSTVMPANLQTATNQLNSMHARTIGGVTYVAVATNFGVTVLNKTNDTNQHIEFDGHDSDNYVWSHTPSTANIYRKVYIAEDGKLYYLWDYNSDTRARVWVIDDISSLPFDSSILSGNSVRDYVIQPNNASSSYPVTALSDTAAALDVNTSEEEFLIGSDVGAERFKGTFSPVSEHPNLSKSRVTRLFAGAALYGQILGHWGSGLQDVGGKGNDLTSAGGSVTVSAVAAGSDLQQINFDETGYLFSNDSDFEFSGPVTIGAWVKTEAGVDDGGYIMAKKSSSKTDFALYRDAFNYLRVDGTTETTIDGLELEGWNFVAATWDGANKKIYIDGQLMAVVADTKVDFDQVSRFVLGRRNGGSDAGIDRLNGAVALPFVVNNAYTGAQVRKVYNSTRDWFEADTQITLQGTSDNVVDVAYGDNGSYFVATTAGVTHFDLTGRVIRTINSGPTTATNVQIVTNDINSIDYKNGWLILAYDARGVEIVNVTREGKESLPRYDNSIYDPYYFY